MPLRYTMGSADHWLGNCIILPSGIFQILRPLSGGASVLPLDIFSKSSPSIRPALLYWTGQKPSDMLMSNCFPPPCLTLR